MNRRMLLAVAVVLAVGAALAWYARKEAAPGETNATPAGEADAVREERAAREAVRDRPGDPQSRVQLARALRRLGRSGEAEGELIRAIQAGLPEPDGQREAVLLMCSRNWNPGMEGLVQRVLRDNPDDPEVLLCVAGAYATQSRWENAEPLYTRLLARDPDRPEWRFQRGVVRMHQSLHATAADDFRAVLARDPAHYEARLFLAHSLLGDARIADAERALQACHIARPGAVEPLVGLASCAVERNDLAAAEALLEQAAGRASDSPLVLQEQATLYLRQQRTDLAIATLKRLVALDPAHRQGHLQLAQAYLAAGNADEARRHEQIYQELDRKEEERLAARRGMR